MQCGSQCCLARSPCLPTVGGLFVAAFGCVVSSSVEGADLGLHIYRLLVSTVGSCCCGHSMTLCVTLFFSF